MDGALEACERVLRERGGCLCFAEIAEDQFQMTVIVGVEDANAKGVRCSRLERLSSAYIHAIQHRSTPAIRRGFVRALIKPIESSRMILDARGGIAIAVRNGNEFVQFGWRYQLRQGSMRKIKVWCASHPSKSAAMPRGARRAAYEVKNGNSSVAVQRHPAVETTYTSVSPAVCAASGK